MDEYKNGIHDDINFVEPFALINCDNNDDIKSLKLKKIKLKIKNSIDFEDNWSDNLDKNDNKIISEYFQKFEDLSPQNNLLH